jgi:hypothetical protein
MPSHAVWSHQSRLPPLTRKKVVVRHADYDGDVASIDACSDNVVVIGLKSNPMLQGWFADMNEKIRKVLGRLSNKLSLEQRRELEEAAQDHADGLP